MSESRPNLLFIMTDHQRADSLGMVQAGVEVTPNLNGLAESSAVFERCYTTCPLCAPARTALATGVYPTANGIVVNDWKGKRAGNFKPMHQYVQEAGYAVGHVGVDHIRVRPAVAKRVNFAAWASWTEYERYLDDLGLESFRRRRGERYTRRIVENQGGQMAPVRYSSAATGGWPTEAEHFPDLWFGRQGEQFLRTRSGPFALFLYLWAPHPPLALPEPYASMFDPAKIDLPANVGLPAAGEPANRRKGIASQLAEGLSEGQWREAWAAHLGLVRIADEAIGGVLTALDRAGLGEDTLTLFTVDHGDHLGQHGMYQKMEMYEPAVRVPLIIRAPGAPPRRFDTPVSHLDVMPTVLAGLGLSAAGALDGVSLLPAVADGAALAERTVFSQYSGNPTRGDIRRAAITRRHKYIYDGDGEAELYDLQADPLEMTNLAGDPARAATVTELHAQCAKWHRARGDWVDYG